MYASPYAEAITAIADLPTQFPVLQIPPGVSFWISRSEPKIVVHETPSRLNGPVKTYEVNVEFHLHCKAGQEILRLNPQPYFLPNGHIDADLFNAEYYQFFRVRKNVTIRRWVSRLDNPLNVFCHIHNAFLLVKRLCNESSNLSKLEQRHCHFA